MISQTNAQRMLYEARLKFQRDEESRLRTTRDAALEEGREEGRRKGRLEGRVLLLQQLLGLREFNVEDFKGLDASQLPELEEQLQQQLRARSK